VDRPHVPEERRSAAGPAPGRADGVAPRPFADRGRRGRALAGAGEWQWPVLGAVSAGGVLGALARYAIGLALPHPHTGVPWSTFVVNVSGCLLIGVLMVLITEVWTGHRLLRPFLGTGVLGGYTTFSTYVVDIHRMVDAGAARAALGYLFGTLAAALLATYGGVVMARAVVRRAGR
jgi:CrcB protein